jgi:hypothetical protein
MLEVFLALALLIAVTVFLTQLIFRMGTKKLINQLESRMRACEQIANQKAIPDDWLRPFQERAAALHRSGSAAGMLEKIGAQAKKRCARQLDELIRFYEHTNLVDSAETRRVLLASLREQRTRWETLDWAAVLDAEPVGDSNRG